MINHNIVQMLEAELERVDDATAFYNATYFDYVRRSGFRGRSYR